MEAPAIVINQEASLIRAAAFALFLLLPALPSALPAQNSPTADAVWVQEQAYWHLVQANDLTGYRSLWDDSFLGWPYVSPEPVRKPHIADWITAHTGKGESLQSFDLERLSIQLTGDLATVAYRAHTTWVDKQSVPTTSAMRIIHTWRRIPRTNEWQIISGMSAPVNADGR
jgi:ketosteroid isomerase-like protein